MFNGSVCTIYILNEVNRLWNYELLRLHNDIKILCVFTKTQSLPWKLPFGVIRQLRWVYVGIIVAIKTFDHLPMDLIFGFLWQKIQMLLLTILGYFIVSSVSVLTPYLHVFVEQNHQKEAEQNRSRHHTRQQRCEEFMGHCSL